MAPCSGCDFWLTSDAPRVPLPVSPKHFHQMLRGWFVDGVDPPAFEFPNPQLLVEQNTIAATVPHSNATPPSSFLACHQHRFSVVLLQPACADRSGESANPCMLCQQARTRQKETQRRRRAMPAQEKRFRADCGNGRERPSLRSAARRVAARVAGSYLRRCASCQFAPFP
jgi:hypothetical protein